MKRSSSVHPAGKPNMEESWQTIAEFAVPSEPGNERRAMEMVAGAVKGLGVPDSRFENLKTAVAEASLNAMEHGNQYNAELEVSIRVSSTPRMLSIQITDSGGDPAFMQEPGTPDLDAKLAGLQSPRGWGIFLIKNMVDEIRFNVDETHHTIELIMHLDENPSAPREG